LVLIFYFAKQFNGTLRTDRVPHDVLPRPQVMARCDNFFNLNSNISNTNFPHSVPRSAAVDECDNLSKAPKTSQILLFYTPVLSCRYDVWEGTHAKDKRQSTSHSLLTSQRCMRVLDCSTGKETFLLTDRSQPNRYHYVAHAWKVGGPRLWYGNNFSKQCYCTWRNNSDALRTKQRNIPNGLGCQYIWGGINSSFVGLRNNKEVHLDSRKSCRLTEQSASVVLSLPSGTVERSLNSTTSHQIGN